MNIKRKERRVFLHRLAIGTGLFGAWWIGRRVGIRPKSKDEKVRLISADGKVVEVDRKHLTKPARVFQSDRELYEWSVNGGENSSA